MSEQSLKERIELGIEAVVSEVRDLRLGTDEYDCFRDWMRAGVILGLEIGFEAGRNRYVHPVGGTGSIFVISDWQYPTFSDLKKEIENENLHCV